MFAETLRTLEKDGSGWANGGIVAGVLLLGAWVVWGATVHVARYEISTAARLETEMAASAVQAPVAGRVVESRLTIGRVVAAGELLVQLDASAQRLLVSERRAAFDSVEREIAGMRAQIGAESAARVEDGRAATAARDEARAGEREARAPANYAAADIARLVRLREQGLISEREFEKGKAAAEQSRAVLERQGVAVTRIEREHRVRDGERETRVRKLETDIARLEGETAGHRAAIAGLENEIERFAIRAPIAGRIGEAATLRAGSVVSEGMKLGAIVPEGNVQIVAQFPPAALGRIAVGQRAALRLDGYAWSEYGAVLAVVSRVAREVRDGSVRVELALDKERPSRAPLGHGLPGVLEVEVERTTPLALVLRRAGQSVAGPETR